jgi:hypothetical protein
VKNLQYFIPLFIIYLSITLSLRDNQLVGDEGRYLEFAQNLWKGHYAQPGLRPGFLWNGPGYPLIIAPFVKLKSSWIIIRLLNILFLMVGVYALFRTMSFIVSDKKAIAFAYAGGLTHYYFMYATTKILTEAFAFGLVALGLLFFIRFYLFAQKKDLWGFTIAGGMLILTKVIFAYVFLVVFILAIATALINRFSKKALTFLSFGFFPLFFCSPYLVYTYHLTGQYFYWADSGGSSLYAMASPYTDEYGSWFSTNPKGFYGSNPIHVKNHTDFIKSINHLSGDGVGYDAALKQKAIEQIKNHPKKYIQNVVLNFGRLFTPYGYTDGAAYVSWLKVPQLLAGVLTFWMGLVSAVIIVVYFRNTFYLPILLFVIISVGLMSLVSAYQRFLFPLYPLFIFLISALFLRYKISLKPL